MTTLEKDLPGRLRLIRFISSNVKKVKLVAFSPLRAVIQLTGLNGAGKSAALDSFEYALLGKRAHPPEPIRRGEDSGYVLLDFGGVVIRRDFVRDARTDEEKDQGKAPYEGTFITVETADGAEFPSPQKMLDRMWASLAHEPEKFAELMNEKERLDFLAKVVPLEEDLTELDRRIEKLFTTRTGVGREAKEREAQFNGYFVDPKWPTVRVEPGPTLAKIRDVQRHNQEVHQTIQLRDRALADAKRQREDAAGFRREIERLTALAELREKEAERLETAAAEVDIPELLAVEPLQLELEEYERTNDLVRQRDEAARLKAAFKAKQDEETALTNEIESLRRHRRGIIKRAKFPVEGLSYADEGPLRLLYEGLAFDQAQLSKRMVIACALVLAANPQLRIILIRHGALLDQNTWAALEVWAEANDVLIIGETVEMTGKIGIVIEDGSIARINGNMAEALT